MPEEASTVETTKPGWKTSEFWQSLIVTLSGSVILIIGAVRNDNTLMIVGGGMMGVSSGGYSIARGMVKRP